MKIAIVYDWATHKRGGAERVLKALAEIYPQADLFTSVYDPDQADWAKEFKSINTTFLQKIPGSIKYSRIWGPLIPLAFEQLNFDKYDLVITITSWPAKAIITKPDTKHICYCLTPPRYIWLKEFTSKFQYLLSCPLRYFDYFYGQRPDKMLTISNYVAKRIKKFYRRTAEVVYPGVNTKKFKPQNKQLAITKDEYFLFIGRLVPYKKTDLVIKAFNQLGLKIKIIGTGRQEHELKDIANKNIEFLKDISENKLVSLYQNCQALIMPQIEDFGLTSLEAQACGRPVIAYNQGGATETIKPNQTGIFFNNQTPESLIEAINKFKKTELSKSACRENALEFNLEKFKQNFKLKINQVINETSKFRH
jgi:glycosyltransferase involved in cell wall biosynthesis